MTKQYLPAFIKGRRVVPSIDFKEIERIHKEWERYDLDGRYRVAPSELKRTIKYVPGETKFKHGGVLTMRSSGDKN